MFNNITTVIFDVDGTLVDSMWIWKQVDIEFLGKRNIPLPIDLQKEIEGKSYTETAIYFKERFCLPDDIDQIKEEWQLLADHFYTHVAPLKNGVKEFIEKVHAKGLKLGIATSNSREIVEKMLATHKIADYFSVIRTSCEVPRSKPFPDVYLKAASDLETASENCLVFEDTVAGVKAAIAAGMTVIAVSDDFSLESRDLLSQLSNMYIMDYYEVLHYFK